MAYFQSSDELRDIFTGFFKEIFSHPQMGPALKKSGIKLKFIYSDPNLSIAVDVAEEPLNLRINDDVFQPEVQMTMKADTAHKFWHGKVNLVAALTRREIVAKGPIPKILKLLPAIRPAYTLYPEYLKKRGLENLIIE